MELPFFERYPEKYKISQEGVANFTDFAYVDDEHEEMLPEYYFPLVGAYRKFPRYKNKRVVDPFIRMYYDENGIKQPEEWGLPKPNRAAELKSTSKYGKDMPPLDDSEIEIMNTAWEMTEAHFGIYMKNARVISYEESKAKIDKSTSSGIPFNSLYSTKKELFEQDPDIDQWLEFDDWERLAEDPNWTSVFTTALKEEIRPSEKTKLNKIRTFCAGATDMTIQGNRLFSDMNERMNASWLCSSSTVGWSPMGGNWDRLLRKLKTFKKGYALDESEYDSSLRSYMMWGCARMRWNMLRDEDKTPQNFRRIRTYYRNLVNSLICCSDGTLIMKLTGNPSGSVNTINDNTLILYCLMAYAWLMLHPDGDTSLGEFEENTAKCLCGDDNTWTVSDWAHDFYNARTLIDVWKTLGVITTTDSLDPREPEELDYLSAHTIFVNGIAVPQYSKEKMITSLLYSNKKKQTPAQALTRACGFLQIGYCDKVMYKFINGVITWLIQHYDYICAEDPEWIIAKCGILSEQRLYKLWTGGDAFYLSTQSVCTTQSISIEKAKKDNKCSIKLIDMNFNSNNGNNKPKPKRRGGKGRKGKATQRNTPWLSRTELFEQSWAGKAKLPRVPSNNKGKGRKRQRTGRRSPNNINKAFDVLEGNFGGQRMLRNPRAFSKPRIEEFDERIGSTNGSVALTTTQFALNPGNIITFPWLNQIAKLYERYKFVDLELYFKHDVSGFATQGQTGLVYLSAFYDASSSAPTTENQIADSDPRVFGMPNEDMCLKLSKQAMHPQNVPKFVRPGIVPGGSDIKEYDAGNLFVTTVGQANGNEVGKLQIRGKVMLFNRLLDPSALAAPTNNQVTLMNGTTGEAAGATGVPHTMLYGTTQFNGLGAVNNAGSIVLPAGNYLVDANVVTQDTSQTNTVALFQLASNGVPLAGQATGGTFITGESYNYEYTLPGFFQSNGVAPLSLIYTATYAAGAVTFISSMLRITAI